MKRLLITVLLVSAFAGIGQEPVKPELVDEFSFAYCDELLARVDSFAIRTRQIPNAKGVIVVSGSNEHLIAKMKLEIPLFYAIRRPGADISSVITMIRGDETGTALARFWLVPDGAKLPVQSPRPWDVTIPTGTKPFHFMSDDDQICSYGRVYAALREILDANPKLRVNAVVQARNDRDFGSKVADIRGWLGKANARRVRFFKEKALKYLEPSNDFWILP